MLLSAQKDIGDDLRFYRHYLYIPLDNPITFDFIGIPMGAEIPDNNGYTFSKNLMPKILN